MKGQGINSIISRKEQLATSSIHSTKEETMVAELHQAIEKKKSCLGNCYYVAMIQLRGGCRVSEVLAITFNDILSNDTVLIRGMKGSRDKIVCVPECVRIFTKSRLNSFNPFYMLNRKTVWSTYRRNGLSVKVPGNKNSSVTHMFRHITADTVRQVSVEGNTVRDVLGHNSNTSQLYYGKSRKK